MAWTNIPPGAQVLCGFSTTKPGDIVDGNYGDVENEATSPTESPVTRTGLRTDAR